jgi:uncharacterized membrane protein YgaE (UPF0421/DUF939 family)
MKEFIDKYYVFTILIVVLATALFVFRYNSEIVSMIIGALVGLLTAPAILPKE